MPNSIALQHKEQLNRKKLRVLFLISFLLALNSAVLAYFNSTYLSLLVGEKNVGLVFTVSYVIAFFGIVYLSFLIGWFGKAGLFVRMVILNIISLVVLVVFAHPYIQLAAFVVYLVSLPLIFVNHDILIETYSADKVTGHIRGTALTIMNLGWVLTPMIAGFLLDKFDFVFMFGLAALIIVPVILITKRSFNINHRERKSAHHLIVSLRKVFKSRALVSVFYVSFLLSFFYAWMVIYTPIYLRDLDYSWGQIGLIFTFMLIPFVLLQYPVGSLADKWGEKKMLVFGLAVMSIATFLIFFVAVPWKLILLLFCTRIGASIVEVLRDTYFYKQIDARQIDIIDFFRTMWPLAYIIGPAIATVFLYFFPIVYLYAFLGVFITSGIYFSLRMPDTK